MGLPLSRCCLAPMRIDYTKPSLVCTACGHVAEMRTEEQALERKRAQTRAAWARSIERNRERNRTYYALNRERILAQAKARYQNDPKHRARALARAAAQRQKRKSQT